MPPNYFCSLHVSHWCCTQTSNLQLQIHHLIFSVNLILHSSFWGPWWLYLCTRPNKGHFCELYLILKAQLSNHWMFFMPSQKTALHPSSISYLESGWRGSSCKQRGPDPPLTEGSRAFPGQLLQHAMGLAGWMRPETVTREASNRHPKQMPKPPCPAPVDGEEHSLSSEPLQSFISPGNHSLSHYPQILQRSSKSSKRDMYLLCMFLPTLFSRKCIFVKQSQSMLLSYWDSQNIG